MEISEAILAEWKRQAQKDNLLDEYEYHLGMIYPPLPYRAWLLKYRALERIQGAADYLEETKTLKRETDLCNALGY